MHHGMRHFDSGGESVENDAANFALQEWQERRAMSRSCTRRAAAKRSTGRASVRVPCASRPPFRSRPESTTGRTLRRHIPAVPEAVSRLSKTTQVLQDSLSAAHRLGRGHGHLELHQVAPARAGTPSEFVERASYRRFALRLPVPPRGGSAGNRHSIPKTIPGFVQNCPTPRVTESTKPFASVSAFFASADGKSNMGLILLISA